MPTLGSPSGIVLQRLVTTLDCIATQGSAMEVSLLLSTDRRESAEAFMQTVGLAQQFQGLLRLQM